MGDAVVKWLALWPHSKTLLGLMPFSVQFAYSPHICVRPVMYSCLLPCDGWNKLNNNKRRLREDRWWQTTKWLNKWGVVKQLRPFYSLLTMIAIQKGMFLLHGTFSHVAIRVTITHESIFYSEILFSFTRTSSLRSFFSAIKIDGLWGHYGETVSLSFTQLKKQQQQQKTTS